MTEIQQSEIVKLMIVTVTQILKEVELVAYELHGVDVSDDGVVSIKLMLINSCLPKSTGSEYTVNICIGKVTEWASEGAEIFVEKLREEISNALMEKKNGKKI